MLLNRQPVQLFLAWVLKVTCLVSCREHFYVPLPSFILFKCLLWVLVISVELTIIVLFLHYNFKQFQRIHCYR